MLREGKAAAYRGNSGISEAAARNFMVAMGNLKLAQAATRWSWNDGRTKKNEVDQRYDGMGRDVAADGGG